MKMSDLIDALEMVVGCFEELGITYSIVGSVASSAYGVARMTMDVDMVAKVETHQVSSLVIALKSDYYIEASMIEDAIRRNASFNLIHLGTMIKIDVFLLSNHPYASEAFARRRLDKLGEPSSHTFYLASPEDLVLSKLQWYQKGGEVSEQQWRDILGILRVQSEKLDIAYLTSWASKLGLSDLLHRSFVEADIKGSA